MPDSVIARVGRWCFGYRWWVVAAWAVAVLAGIVSTGPLFSRLADSGVPRSVESLAGSDVASTGNTSAGTINGIVSDIDRSRPTSRPP